MQASKGAGDTGLPPPMAEINVTPLVDVMLVLLIIFMVSAPMFNMSQGMQVAVPSADVGPMPPQQREPIVVSIQKGGGVYLFKTAVPVADLGAKVKPAVDSGKYGKVVLIKADKTVAYGTVMEAMASLKQAGVDDVGLVTERPVQKPAK